MKRLEIPVATGARVTRESLLAGKPRVSIEGFGASREAPATTNTRACRAAIAHCSGLGGGTVVVPRGIFRIYTLRLASGVNLELSEGAILRAARTDIWNTRRNDLGTDLRQDGEGGLYDEPEVNRWCGLQDHGHTYVANSLIAGIGVENVAILGPGCFEGSAPSATGSHREHVLQLGDPETPARRGDPGHRGEWFGNKGISLLNSRGIVLSGFEFLSGGHFAVLATNVDDLLIEGVSLDTGRDGIDIDSCRDVTVRTSRVNAPNDDAIVIKSSCGGGVVTPVRNVLIEDCTVTGFDEGSALDGTFTWNRRTADDQCPPTGRVKLGTESTGGYERITVRRVHFERSRGFALEAVDGSDLSDVIFIDSDMQEMSSSPLFLRIGDRCRFPVTGVSEDDALTHQDLRLDNPEWVLPAGGGDPAFPARRQVPAYRRSAVDVDGERRIEVIDPDQPLRANPSACAHVGEKLVAWRFDEESSSYVPDPDRPLSEHDVLLRGNALGTARPARLRRVEIGRIRVRDADPRHPVILAGLVDSPIEDVEIHDLDVEYRGGLTMRDAVEQPRVTTTQDCQTFVGPLTESLEWMVNPFEAKNEVLLPRVHWDEATTSWRDDPYAVPEAVTGYPEPSMFGILPASGLYARHVRGLRLDRIRMGWRIADTRPVVVLDDADDVEVGEFSADPPEGVPVFVRVTNEWVRRTNFEYVPDEPFRATCVRAVLPAGSTVCDCAVGAPSPGTPPDGLHPFPTIADRGSGFVRHERALPVTVFGAVPSPRP